MPKRDQMHRRFAEAIVKGLTGAAAARAAGSTSTSDGALKVLACKLMKKPEVKALIAELTTKATTAAVNDAAKRREILSGIQNDPTAAHADRIRAIDVHNKMDGEYIEKHEHSGAVTLIFGSADERL